VSRGSSYPESRCEGRFFGRGVNCEQVPFLPAWAVAWVLDGPRKIPYLLVWKRPEDSSVREVVRISTYGQFPPDWADWAEIKRPDGTYSEETAKQRPENFLDALSNSGPAARLYSEGRATGCQTTNSTRKDKQNAIHGHRQMLRK
jgi:hypothetical protein